MGFSRKAGAVYARLKLFGASMALLGAFAAAAQAGTVVRFDTVFGTYDIQLFDEAMPNTVDNFLGYVDTQRYDGTAIHRSSDIADPIERDYLIQGGGFSFGEPYPGDPNQLITFEEVDADAPIADEPGGGVAGPSNVRGTIAMAKFGPNYADSEWLIHQGDNSFLDDPAQSHGGFSAFGVVLNDGMDVVDAIGELPIPHDFGFDIYAANGEFLNLPLRDFDGSSIFDITLDHIVTVNSVARLELVPGDFDLDGDADNDDLAILSANLGTEIGAYLDQGDADMDGDVDGADFLIWQSSSAPPATGGAAHNVPEPSTWALLALFAGLHVGRRAFSLRGCK